MKSLSEIYYSHKNWLEDEEHPHCQKERVIHIEMYEEADQYVKELTTIKDNWKNVLKFDVSVLNPYDRVIRYRYFALNSPEYYFDKSYWCNDGGLSDEEYKYLMHVELVENFLYCVQDAVRRYFNEDVNLIEFVKKEAIEDEKKPADTSTPSAEIMEDATDLTPATNENQGKGTAGRPTADDFTTYFKNPEWAKFLLPALHEILDGKKGTFRAKVIAAITDVYINKPALKSVHDEFNDGIKDSTFELQYNRHYGDYYRYKKKPFPEDELEAIRNELLEICNQEHEAAGGHVSDTSTP